MGAQGHEREVRREEGRMVGVEERGNFHWQIYLKLSTIHFHEISQRELIEVGGGFCSVGNTVVSLR